MNQWGDVRWATPRCLPGCCSPSVGREWRLARRVWSYAACRVCGHRELRARRFR